jgi:glycosyltransferase involved in cell wall biosynthesis
MTSPVVPPAPAQPEKPEALSGHADPAALDRLAETRAEAEAARAQLLQAQTRLRAAEAQALALEVELQLLRAERAAAVQPGSLATTPANGRAAAQGLPARPPEAGSRVFFDASLVLHHGFLSAVGIVRVEHYVAEFLANDDRVALDFVTWDRTLSAYRALSGAERELLEQILFHRYADTTPSVAEAESEAAAASVAARHGSGGTWARLRPRLALAASLSPADFGPVLSRLALRHMPVRPDHSVLRRLATKVARRAALAAARASHRGLRGAVGLRRQLNLRLYDPVADAAAPQPHATPAALAPTGVPAASPFRRGDVLVSMANTWDYLDYRYLDRICRQEGVRFLCVIYDVVGMELPFVTPAPPSLYHRHWVEIGHVAERLLAISRFSTDSYQRFIAGPNDLSVRVDYALLPNFLQERAAEIGEAAVPLLEGRSFVVYCSTIEVRKNHQILLHLWDALREAVGPDKLPQLVFVGKWGWSTEGVKLLSERNWRLRPHLSILDRVSDAELIWLYRNARFTVFPSFSEGFGLAAAESLSFGTPVVTAHCPALIEATEGLMPSYHPLDFMGWLQELTGLIEDDAKLAALREAAARFRGPSYDAFAALVRDAALAPPPEASATPAVRATGGSLSA